MQQLRALSQALGCHWLELVKEDATVVFDAKERERVQRIRALSPEAQAKLDAFLAIELGPEPPE